jgi:uncharacterized protein YndB with AHSA1/START domain
VYHTQRVFEDWLDPELARKWLFATASRPMMHVAIDARIGGVFHLAERRNGENAEHHGQYIEIVPRKLGSELYLHHENVPIDRVGAIKARWTRILYGLGEILAS